MVSGSLALLYFLGFHGGSWAAAPIGDEVLLNGEIFPTYVRSPLWAIQPGLRPSQPGLKHEA